MKRNQTGLGWGLRAVVLGLIAAAFFASLLWFCFDRHSYISFLERFVSPDGHIERPLAMFVVFQFEFIGLSLLWILITSKSFAKSLKESSQINKCAYVVILLVFISYTVYQLSMKPSILQNLYREDGFFESLTALCAVSAGILLALSIRAQEGRGAIAIKIILAALFFCFGMEEISFGQRIFNLKTPEMLMKINYQRELNTHNLFNPYFNLLYPVFNFVMYFVFSKLEKFRPFTVNLLGEDANKSIIPYREAEIYGLIFLLLFLHSFLSTELTEEVVAIIICAYAADQFRISRFSRKQPCPAK